MLNALSVDLEDWYQGLTSTGWQVDRWPEFQDRVADSTDRLLCLLDRARLRATFFVLGYVADQFPDVVRRVAGAGHEIALHGYYHRQVFRLSPEAFREDVMRGREAVEAAGGRRPIGYRAPMFSINGSALWALEVLRDLGFRYDSSVFPTRNMLYGYPDAPRLPYRPWPGDAFVEFPLSTVRLLGVNWPLAGGFYLRAMPVGLFAAGLRRLNRLGHPAILYFHPWEIDPGHPRPNPTARERLTHYYNLDRMEAKLTRLFEEFEFAPLSTLLAQYETDPGAARAGAARRWM